MIQIPINEIYLGFLVLTRTTAMFFMIPLFTSATIPPQVRLALAGGISLMLLPLVATTPYQPVDTVGAVWALMGEIYVGFVMGFSISMVFYALEFAAEIMGVEASLMRSQSFDPSMEVEGNILTSLYFLLAMMVFMATGTDLEVIASLVQSYEFVPAGMGLFSQRGVEYMTLQTAGVFELGLRIAAPMVAMSLVVNLVFAVLGKVSAKINVLVLSFGIKIVLAMLMLSMSVPLILRYILDGFEGTGVRMLESLVAK